MIITENKEKENGNDGKDEPDIFWWVSSVHISSVGCGVEVLPQEEKGNVAVFLSGIDRECLALVSSGENLIITGRNTSADGTMVSAEQKITVHIPRGLEVNIRDVAGDIEVRNTGGMVRIIRLTSKAKISHASYAEIYMGGEGEATLEDVKSLHVTFPKETMCSDVKDYFEGVCPSARIHASDDRVEITARCGFEKIKIKRVSKEIVPE